MVDLPARTWIAAALVFAAVALGVVALAILSEWFRDMRRRKLVTEQLETMLRDSFDTLDGSSPALLQRSRGGSEPAWVQALSARVPSVRDVAHRLEQAQVPWSVRTYLLVSLGLALAFGLAALVLSGIWMLAIISAAFGSFLPHAHITRKRTLRLRKFEEQLPDAIDLIARAIRAGHPLSAGLKMAAEEMPEPVSGEFRRVFEEQRFGLPFEDALLSLVDRVELVDTRILVTAILIQREVGGNLAEILDKLAQTIRSRFTFQRQLRVYTAQGRLSGYVLAILPLAVGSVILLIEPDYTLTLFREPVGRMMVVAAAILQIAGFLWIRKIVNIDF